MTAKIAMPNQPKYLPRERKASGVHTKPSAMLEMYVAFRAYPAP